MQFGLLLTGLTFLLSLEACSPMSSSGSEAAAHLDGEHVQEVEEWQGQRLADLQAEDGWLTLAGLFWLKRGANTFGSDPANDIVLPGDSTPPLAGTLYLREDGRVWVRAFAEAQLQVDGETVTDRELRSDDGGNPDILRLGDLRLHVIKRGERYAVRAKDPNSPTRKNFTGLEYYPADPDYRVSARFVAYDSPREVAVPTVLATVDQMVAPGLVEFTLKGERLTLEPFLQTPDADRLFFIFKDETSGEGTYPAGRYLYSDLPAEGQVVLDFNKAYTPPCAFTPYATCAYPHRRNWLPIRIEAGEKHAGRLK